MEEILVGKPENPVSFQPATRLVPSIETHWVMIRPVTPDITFSKRRKRKETPGASDYTRSTRDDEAEPETEGGSHSSGSKNRALGTKSVFRKRQGARERKRLCWKFNNATDVSALNPECSRTRYTGYATQGCCVAGIPPTSR